ncbi:MAG: hypothetical protein COX20_03285, partial [Desulfobacterales bacterium CG23_combo_of_CG06-09_8_20_14_all_52_9]
RKDFQPICIFRPLICIKIVPMIYFLGFISVMPSQNFYSLLLFHFAIPSECFRITFPSLQNWIASKSKRPERAYMGCWIYDLAGASLNTVNRLFRHTTYAVGLDSF